jgi:hypothetical protein
MKTFGYRLPATLVLVAGLALGTQEARSADLVRGVPADAYLAVYAKHNPERDFQRAYLEEIWETVKETRIFERALKIVADRLPEGDVEKAKSIMNRLQEAAAPFDLEAVANAEESVYAQFMVSGSAESMQPMTAHHLALIRVTPEAATSCEEAIKNLFALAEEYSEGALTVNSVVVGESLVTTLALPGPVPFRPTVARLGDVLLLSSTEDVARRSLAMLAGGEGESKFDDPRLKEALAKLPEPEDAIVFYDGRQQFAKMRGIADFVRQIARDNPEAGRVAGLMELFFDEMSIPDYEVTVGYTEGNLNRTAAYSKLMPGAEDKLLGKVLLGGDQFEDWQSWVPRDALSYSLWTGINLHPVYEKVVEVIDERIPEAKPGLEQFEAIQAELGVHLDRDLLQALSGECVSVTLPSATPGPWGGVESVTAIRCRKPDRTRELLHLAVDKLNEFPAVASQQLKLVECENLEGFEELSALMLAPFGVRPVIGFHDGWMFLGSNTAAVKTVLDARAGQGESPISDSEAFQRFHLEVDGPVYKLSYSNTAESTRQAAKALNQVGAMAPMILGMAGAQGNPEAIKPIQEVMGLLPSVAQIVSKFDFLEATLSVTQAGDEPGTFMKRSVTVVREPEKETE